jgi:putative FmdB family regulatory protein
MPIYEFRCNACRRRSSVFTRAVRSDASAACEHCGSPDTARLFSRVAVLRSDSDDGFGGMSESAFANVDESDPRSMARFMRKMSRDMGEPLDASMEADLDRMEAGEMPDDDGGLEDDFASVD